MTPSRIETATFKLVMPQPTAPQSLGISVKEGNIVEVFAEI
jgi:hypothetical protein